LSTCTICGVCSWCKCLARNPRANDDGGLKAATNNILLTSFLEDTWLGRQRLHRP
jgi:hypothetical protein